MLKNAKENNQYYGKLFETAVVAQLNQEPLCYEENYEFSEVEKQAMLKEAQVVADYLKGYTAVYTGNHTSLASGDIVLSSGETVELKRVSAGAGTYFNTSIYYFEKFGFNFKNYMEKYGLYDALEEYFGKEYKISRINNSPVSRDNSSKIRHTFEEIYQEQIVPIDKTVRTEFLRDLATYFSQHPESLYEFVMDMLNKNSATSQKAAPDRLIVYNYIKNTLNEIDIASYANQDLTFEITEKGMKIGNIRVAIGWQNGNGLNNPTIRIFL